MQLFPVEGDVAEGPAQLAPTAEVLQNAEGGQKGNSRSRGRQEVRGRGHGSAKSRTTLQACIIETLRKSMETQRLQLEAARHKRGRIEHFNH